MILMIRAYFRLPKVIIQKRTYKATLTKGQPWSVRKYKELLEGGQGIDHYLGDTGVSGFLCLGIAPSGLFGTSELDRTNSINSWW